MTNLSKKTVNKAPLVYIVMPCYNWEKYLLEQLMSIYHQNYTNWYLIFVNDWSTDNSENILRDRVSHYNLHEKVKVITKENGWVNSAVQRWLEEVKKLCDIKDSDSLISYCDADDIWTRDKLEIQVEYMVNHPKCDLSYHNLTVINENGLLVEASYYSTIYVNLSFLYISTIRSILISTEMVFRVKYINHLLPMPVWFWMYQDYRTALVFSALNYNIKFIDKSLAYYRQWHFSLMKVLYNTPQRNKEWLMKKIKYLNELKRICPDKDFSYEIWFLNDLLYKRMNWKYGIIRFWIFVFFKYTRVFSFVLKKAFYENILHINKRFKYK